MQEERAPAAYLVDDTVHEMTLACKDQNTLIVTAAIKAYAFDVSDTNTHYNIYDVVSGVVIKHFHF